MTSTSVWRRDERVLWRRSADRAVLLPASGDDLVVLDGVGRVIWELLDEPWTEASLIAELAEGFDRPVRDVTADVRPFLAQLCAAGCLIAEPAPCQSAGTLERDGGDGPEDLA